MSSCLLPSWIEKDWKKKEVRRTKENLGDCRSTVVSDRVCGEIQNGAHAERTSNPLLLMRTLIYFPVLSKSVQIKRMLQYVY